MTPYYEDELVQLWHGDSRDVLPTLVGSFESVVTDPVWPNAPESIPGHDEHVALMTAISTALLGRADRLVIHLGSTCDPRWLMAVNSAWPFLTMQHLEYAMPSYRGRVMLNDVAYTFGSYPSRKNCGWNVAAGRITCTSPRDVKSHEHPAARSLEHVAGLIRWWVTTGPVLDPFVGSGTTLLAAKRAGVRIVGIEREERFCELAVSRLRQKRMVFA